MADGWRERRERRRTCFCREILGNSCSVLRDSMRAQMRHGSESKCSELVSRHSRSRNASLANNSAAVEWANFRMYLCILNFALRFNRSSHLGRWTRLSQNLHLGGQKLTADVTNTSAAIGHVPHLLPTAGPVLQNTLEQKSSWKQARSLSSRGHNLEDPHLLFIIPAHVSPLKILPIRGNSDGGVFQSVAI